MCLFLLRHRYNAVCPIRNDLIEPLKRCRRGQRARPFFPNRDLAGLLLDLLLTVTALVMRRF